MPTQALYSQANSSAAYQLIWSLSVFGRVPFPTDSLNLEKLDTELAKDQVRILESHFRSENVVHGKYDRGAI